MPSSAWGRQLGLPRQEREDWMSRCLAATAFPQREKVVFILTLRKILVNNRTL